MKTKRATTSTKTRTASDPRVKRVMRAVDAAIASPNKNRLRNSLSMLLSFGQACEMFDEIEGWTPAGARESVLAFALHLPDALLDELAKVGDKELAWVRYEDRRGHLESKLRRVTLDPRELTMKQLRKAVREQAVAPEQSEAGAS